MRHHDLARFDLIEKTQRFNVGHNLFACLETVETAIGFRRFVVDAAIDRQNIDLRQIVALADFKVVEVMGWRDLHRTGPLFGICVFIKHNRNATANEWQFDEGTGEVLVAFVFGVHGDGAVAQHGFGTCRGDDDVAAIFPSRRLAVFVKLARITHGLAVGERIAEMPEVAFDFDVFDFEIGNGGL